MKRFLEEFKDLIYNKVSAMNVCVTELDSARFTGDCMGGWEFDDEEMWLKQAQMALDCLEADSWYDFIYPEDDNNRWYNEYLNRTPAYQRVQEIAEKYLDELVFVCQLDYTESQWRE